MEYPVQFPGITIGDIYIHEPGGLITDSLIALLCLFCVVKIGKPKDAFQKYWSLFILFIGIGGLGGALVHGFPKALGPEGFYFFWVVKNLFLPVGNYFAAYIVLAGIFPNKLSTLKSVLITKAILACVAMIWVNSFLPIAIDIALTYFIVIYGASKLKRTSCAYAIIRTAFIVALISGVLYVVKYDIDPLWFSHKHMVHVFVLLSVYLIYKAIRKEKAIYL